MGRRRAVLFGVEKYVERAGFSDLPVVRADVPLLAQSLASSGYEVDQTNVGELIKTQLLNKIKAALDDAESEETLIIYFTGHGVYHNRSTYLVPSESGIRNPENRKTHAPEELQDYLVSLDRVRRNIEASRARNIIFLIDACREGLNYFIDESPDGSKGIKGLIEDESYTPQQLQQADEKAVWFVFSCSPGRTSHFGPADGHKQISYFTLAASKAFSASSSPSNLREVVAFIECELKAQNQGDAQTVRNEAQAPTDADLRVICESSDKIGERNIWLDGVNESSLLPIDTENQLDRELRAAVSQVVELCWEQWRSAYNLFSNDSWLDVEFPIRVVRKLELLAKQFIGMDKLSPPELALLMVAPFVREAVFACARGAILKSDPEGMNDGWTRAPQRAIAVLREGNPRLVRKMERLKSKGDVVAQRATAASMLHVGLLKSVEIWQPGADDALPQSFFQELDQQSKDWGTVARKVFERWSLIRLARVIHGASERLFRRNENTPWTYSNRSIGDFKGESLWVREQSVGAMLCVAGWLAIDVRTLDSVIVDHFGLSPELSLDPAELISNVREIGGASVTTDRDAFELRGTVTHAALDKAFQSHADKLRQLLVSFSDSNWDAAQRLSGCDKFPALVRTNGLVPAMVETNGKQEHRFTAGPHIAFSLAEYEVRELLMGERLYGDPTLAIRELYQNALDACRFREARLTYLKRKEGSTLIDQWKPGIEIIQGTDGQGNEYIQCRDFGIGMDRTTLEKCFAKAGSRFADATEFLEEQADWRSIAEPVEFYPNSQFGVGVFSYFMLADEIRIRTRRLRKDGHPENRMLDVRVSGSGSLFHIKEIDGQQTEFPDAGTEITLYLNRTEYELEGKAKRILASETLSRLLWIAEFPTWVRHGEDTIHWTPMKLRHPEGKASAKGVTADVWWLPTKEGKILCDGILTEMQQPFAVINLRRKHRPELTVDRRRIRKKDEKYFHGLLIDNLASLTHVPPWLNYSWFWDFSNMYEEPGKHLLKLFEDQDTKLQLTVGQSSHSVSTLAVGCNSLDDFALHPDLRNRNRDRDHRDRSREREILDVLTPKFRAIRTRILRTALENTGGVVRDAEWHYLTWSDKDRIATSTDPFGRPLLKGPVSGAHILGAAQKLEESPGAAYARIKKYASLLTLELPQVDAEQLNLLDWSDTDRIAMSRALDGGLPWLEGHVSVAHILGAAQKLEESPGATYARIKKYETLFTLELPRVDPEQLNQFTWSDKDRIAMSRRMDGCRAWLEGPVSGAHILGAAQKLEESPGAAYARIKKYASLLTLELPQVDAEQLNLLDWSDTDRIAMSRALDGGLPWLEGHVSVAHILGAAQKLEESPGATYARIKKYESLVTLELPQVDPEQLNQFTWSDKDRIAMSRGMDGRRAWLEGHVSVAHILRAAQKLEESPGATYARIKKYASLLTLELPQVDAEQLNQFTWSDKDRTAMSHALDGSLPWLKGPVSVAHILRASQELEESPGTTYARIKKYASLFALELPQVDAEQLNPLDWSDKDRIAMSRSLDRSRALGGRRAWLEGPVSVAHILEAAQELEESAGTTYARVKKYASLFTLELPQVDAEQLNQLTWSENDRIAMSVEVDGRRPWLAGPVSVAHILAAAKDLKESPGATYERIKKYESIFALELPQVDAEQLNQLNWSENDRIALSQNLSGKSPFLEVIDSQHVTYAAWYIGESEDQIRERLRRFTVLGIRIADE